MSVETVKNATVHNTKGDLFSSLDVADFEVPQGRDEVWRFVPLRRLRGLHTGEFAPAVAGTIAVSSDGVTGFSHTQEAKDFHRVTVSGKPIDRVGAQAFSSAPHVEYLHFARESINEQPVTITVTGAGDQVTSFSHIVVDVEAGAEAVVDLRYVGSGTPCR